MRLRELLTPSLEVWKHRYRAEFAWHRPRQGRRIAEAPRPDGVQHAFTGVARREQPVCLCSAKHQRERRVRIILIEQLVTLGSVPRRANDRSTRDQALTRPSRVPPRDCQTAYSLVAGGRRTAPALTEM